MTADAPPAASKPFGRSLFGLPLGALRGVGQVNFQASVWTSAVLLAGLWVGSWKIGLFATIGAAVSTVAARLLAVPHDTLTQGLMSYCGVLGGIAMVFYLGNHPSTYALAVVAAIMCTLITATLNVFLKPYGLKAFTGPFCLVSAVMLLGAPSFARVWHGTPAAARTPKSTYVHWSNLWHGFFSNISQIFFVETWHAGAIMMLGMALAGWRVGVFTALGSITGLLTAWALGAPAELIDHGLYGYNAVLTSIAFGVVFLRLTAWNIVYTVAAAAASTGLTASLTSLFNTVGSHTFTWPFNITTWAMLAAVPLLPRITTQAGAMTSATPIPPEEGAQHP